jgi:hypothetical protein
MIGIKQLWLNSVQSRVAPHHRYAQFQSTKQ